MNVNGIPVGMFGVIPDPPLPLDCDMIYREEDCYYCISREDCKKAAEERADKQE